MSLYYLLLLMTRFHNDPRFGVMLFNAGFVVVTPAKVVGLLTVLAAVFADRPKGAAPRGASALGLLWAAFAIMQMLGTFAFGLPIPSESISSLLSFTLMLVATRLLITTEDRMSKSLRVLVLTSALASLWLYREYFWQHFYRAEGVEQDSNYEALTLVMSIPLAVWMARYEATRFWRRVAAGCTVVMGGGLLLTQSRAGLISAAVMGLAAVFYSRRKGAALAMLALVAAVAIEFAPPRLLNRFYHIKLNGAVTNGDDESSRLHYELLKAGLAMIGSQPLTGVGLQRFRDEAPAYNPEIVQIAGHSYIAHDTYVQIAAESGLPALALFLSLMGLAALNCRAVRRRPGRSMSQLALAMQIALIGFSIGASSVTAEYVVPFWLIIFFSQNLREIAAAAAFDPAPERPAPEKPRERTSVTAPTRPSFGRLEPGEKRVEPLRIVMPRAAASRSAWARKQGRAE